MKVVGLSEIRAVLAEIDLLPLLEEGFAAYSAGRANVPPVGELLLPEGEVHIKYGALEGDEFYVVKIASGFYGNPARGLPSGNGLMLLFRQATGEPVALLLDEAYLTDVRTAAAGAIAARHLAPRRVERVGVAGTGVQGRLQAIHLKPVTPCRDLLVWGRGEEQLAAYRAALEREGFRIETTRDPAELLRTCNLVVTATAARQPLLAAADLRPGTHLTAVGSDTPDKQELEAAILARADLVVADSIPQCLLRGEIHHALAAGLIAEDDLIELGAVIAGTAPGRTTDDQITVADLTGVAVQDIKIAEAVYRRLAG